jgi:hypothetical protein
VQVADRPVVVAAAGRPRPGEAISGDAWAVDWHGGVCRIAVVDGLGHGPEAAAAAQAALKALQAQPDLDPAEALRLCHRALAGTRGAAISVAAIDLVAARLTYAGVGNIEAHLRQRGQRQRPIAYRGIVGYALPTIRPAEFTLEADWLLVMHTDGVSARLDLDCLVEFTDRQPQALADAALRRVRQQTDDATVVVALAGELTRQPRERPDDGSGA